MRPTISRLGPPRPTPSVDPPSGSRAPGQLLETRKQTKPRVVLILLLMISLLLQALAGRTLASGRR